MKFLANLISDHPMLAIAIFAGAAALCTNLPFLQPEAPRHYNPWAPDPAANPAPRPSSGD